MKQRLFILTICLIATLKMMAQEFTLHGRVTDEDSHPYRACHRIRGQARDR